MYITTLVTIGPINGTFQTEYLCVLRASWQDASVLSITFAITIVNVSNVIQTHKIALLKLLNFFFRKDFYSNWSSMNTMPGRKCLNMHTPYSRQKRKNYNYGLTFFPLQPILALSVRVQSKCNNCKKDLFFFFIDAALVITTVPVM